MKVPSKDYGRQYDALLPELLPLIEGVLRGENPVLGRSVDAFETAFAKYIGVEHVVGVGTGTDALVLALRVLGVGSGDEVITAGNTFIATVTAILAVGARPVLVDPDPETMNLDAIAVEAALTPRTAAVVPVHLYGRLASIGGLAALCTDRGLHLVEDAAQAHGARDDAGRAAGSFGALGCFSFHPSKNLGAFGDGGAIVTNDADLVDELRARRNLGKSSKYEVKYVAPNSKLDTLQAAILLAKLPGLDALNDRRRDIARRYRARLGDLAGLRIPDFGPDGAHVHHLFPVFTNRRDELRAHLTAAGIKAGMHYPIPPHLQPLDVDLGYAHGDLPVTEELAATELSLPIAPELRDVEIEAVCAAVEEFFAG